MPHFAVLQPSWDGFLHTYQQLCGQYDARAAFLEVGASRACDRTGSDALRKPGLLNRAPSRSAASRRSSARSTTQASQFHQALLCARSLGCLNTSLLSFSRRPCILCSKTGSFKSRQLFAAQAAAARGSVAESRASSPGDVDSVNGTSQSTHVEEFPPDASTAGDAAPQSGSCEPSCSERSNGLASAGRSNGFASNGRAQNRVPNEGEDAAQSMVGAEGSSKPGQQAEAEPVVPMMMHVTHVPEGDSSERAVPPRLRCEGVLRALWLHSGLALFKRLSLTRLLLERADVDVRAAPLPTLRLQSHLTAQASAPPAVPICLRAWRDSLPSLRNVRLRAAAESAPFSP
eukprot:4769684-Pleurochrysis_carterae.AAC.5